MKLKGLLAALFAAFFVSIFVAQADAQTAPKSGFAGYKGVLIGMPMAEARAKLGDARDKSDSADYYVYGDNESVQVLYAPDKTVRVISVNYLGKAAPLPVDVLGVSVEAKPDGSVNKLVRFPKAGYWISYVKTPGDDPVTVITVQKLAGGQ